jgi:hypothetical protein
MACIEYTMITTNNSYQLFEGQTTDHAAKLITILNSKLVSSEITGSFFESGTFRGKSAAIFLTLPNVTRGVLVDVADYLEQDKLRSSVPTPFVFLKYKSEDAFAEGLVKKNLPSNDVVWAHLDASHYFSNISLELQSITEFMHGNGIICLDDWNDVYSQIRAAYYYLSYACSFGWELFLTGFNKAFLCRREHFSDWNDYTISTFSQDVTVDGAPFLVQLQRTDESPYSRSFALRPRKIGDPNLYGLHIWGNKFYRMHAIGP